MKLTTRLLPRAEWGEVLTGTDLGVVAQLMPEETVIIAVEDDGVLVGCWSLTRMWQAEGLWIAPAAAKSSTVGRRLLKAMRDQAKAVGTHIVLTGAMTDEVEALLVKVGAEPLPIRVYQWPMDTAEGVH